MRIVVMLGLSLLASPSCAAQQSPPVTYVHPGDRVKFTVTLADKKVEYVVLYAQCGPRLADSLASSASEHEAGGKAFTVQFYVPPNWPTGKCVATSMMTYWKRNSHVRAYDVPPLTFTVVKPREEN